MPPMKFSFSITLKSASHGPRTLIGTDFSREAHSLAERLDELITNWPEQSMLNVSFDLSADPISQPCQQAAIDLRAEHVFHRHTQLVRKSANHLAKLRNFRPRSGLCSTEVQHFMPFEGVVVGQNHTGACVWLKLKISVDTDDVTRTKRVLTAQWPGFVSVATGTPLPHAERGAMLMASLGRLLNLTRWAITYDHDLTTAPLSRASWDKITLRCEDPWDAVEPTQAHEPESEEASEGTL